jgi:hypothetical protein
LKAPVGELEEAYIHENEEYSKQKDEKSLSSLGAEAAQAKLVIQY